MGTDHAWALRIATASAFIVDASEVDSAFATPHCPASTHPTAASSQRIARGSESWRVGPPAARRRQRRERGQGKRRRRRLGGLKGRGVGHEGGGGGERVRSDASEQVDQRGGCLAEERRCLVAVAEQHARSRSKATETRSPCAVSTDWRRATGDAHDCPARAHAFAWLAAPPTKRLHQRADAAVELAQRRRQHPLLAEAHQQSELPPPRRRRRRVVGAAVGVALARRVVGRGELALVGVERRRVRFHLLLQDGSEGAEGEKLEQRRLEWGAEVVVVEDARLVGLLELRAEVGVGEALEPNVRQ